jgi:tetratricopeptide (TPR) repeat protein
VRVEDSAVPLVELRRLLRLRQAYNLAERADDLTAEGRKQEAALFYRRSMEIAPENAELRFWGGLALVQLNERLAGLEAVQSAIEENEGLGRLLNRLSPEIAPSAPAVREALGGDDD